MIASVALPKTIAPRPQDTSQSVGASVLRASLAQTPAKDATEPDSRRLFDIALQLCYAGASFQWGTNVEPVPVCRDYSRTSRAPRYWGAETGWEGFAARRIA